MNSQYSYIKMQGCVDYEDVICPLANKCLRREFAIMAPRGVTLIAAPYNEDNNKCEYFIEKGENSEKSKHWNK